MQNLKKYIKYIIPLVVGIKLGSWIGWANHQVSYVQESKLERIAEDKSIAIHPKSGEKYLIDFSNKVVIPYSNERLARFKKEAEMNYLIKK